MAVMAVRRRRQQQLRLVRALAQVEPPLEQPDAAAAARDQLDADQLLRAGGDRSFCPSAAHLDRAIGHETDRPGGRVVRVVTSFQASGFNSPSSICSSLASR